MKEYNGYQLTDHGTIRGPGKFEGEWFPALFYYDAWNAGAADAEFDFGGDGIVDAVAFFVVSDDDRRCVPELADTYGCALHNDDQGFISAAWYETKAEYDAAMDKCESDAELFSTGEEEDR